MLRYTDFISGRWSPHNLKLLRFRNTLLSWSKKNNFPLWTMLINYALREGENSDIARVLIIFFLASHHSGMMNKDHSIFLKFHLEFSSTWSSLNRHSFIHFGDIDCHLGHSKHTSDSTGPMHLTWPHYFADARADVSKKILDVCLHCAIKAHPFSCATHATLHKKDLVLITQLIKGMSLLQSIPRLQSKIAGFH